MKKKLINFLFIVLIIIFIILAFLNKDILSDICINSLELFITKVFPFLFIMFIMQDLLINYNFHKYINKIIGRIFNKLFNLNNYSLMIFILSIIGGSPSSAYLINKLFEEKKIDKKTAENMLTFTYFANPLFLYNILFLIFNNYFIVFKIIIVHYFSNFILAFIMKNNNINNNIYNIDTQNKFSVLLSKSIKNSMNLNIMILGNITFFMIISTFLTLLINNNYISIFIKGILEITGGLNNLIDINITLKIKEIIAITIISFGGFSIHFQVISIINNNLNYKYFFKGRILATLIGIILILIFFT